ncbi:MAG: zinc-ribbon domain-containing protein [Oscillospiraceae bacterium]|nr:zinc-ribbon domain-containing protein [Oscillospiraceae bacterium]
MVFCEECGAQLKEGAKFCAVCGAKTKPNEQQAQNSIMSAQQQYQPQPVKEKKKMPAGLLALIIVIPILIVLAAGGFGVYTLFFNKPNDIISEGKITDPLESVSKNELVLTGDIELPYVSYTYLDKKPEAVIEFTAVDSIFPSNYRMMDSLIIFTGYSDYGELDVMIEVEVPGFTQLYKQKITLGRQVTKLRIIPPLVTGTIDLNMEKTAQLVYSVTEIDTGKILVQESKNLKLYSKFDMVWGDEYDWDAYTDNILAWMTPDSPEILQLKRDAIDYLELISDGALNALLGYQDYNFFDHDYYNTWVQAVAIQGAMSDITKVRYNNSHFSMDAQQRVKLPADTLNSKSGLCIETSLVMASALQSTGMHVMLIFPPGHAQVAVEAWPGTGDYFLIETTVLPMAQDMDTWNNTVIFLDSEDWLGYITGEGYFTYGPCYIVDCDLGEKLGIRAMSN